MFGAQQAAITWHDVIYAVVTALCNAAEQPERE
jgi:hypothetical protein